MEETQHIKTELLLTRGEVSGRNLDTLEFPYVTIPMAGAKPGVQKSQRLISGTFWGKF